MQLPPSEAAAFLVANTDEYALLQVARMLSVGLVPQDWVPDGVASRYGNRLQATEPTLIGWRTVLQVGALHFLYDQSADVDGYSLKWLTGMLGPCLC